MHVSAVIAPEQPEHDKCRVLRATHLVPHIVGVDRNSRVTEQRFRTSRRDDNLLVRTLERVGERGDDTKLELFFRVVPRD